MTFPDFSALKFRFALYSAFMYLFQFVWGQAEKALLFFGTLSEF